MSRLYGVVLVALGMSLLPPASFAQQRSQFDPKDLAVARLAEQLPPGAADALVALLHDENRDFVASPFVLLFYADKAIDRDPDTALAWYYFARLRIGYDVARCRDPTTEAITTMASFMAKKIIVFAKDNPKAAVQGIERALRWDEQYDGPGAKTDGVAVCASRLIAPGSSSVSAPKLQGGAQLTDTPWLHDRSMWPSAKAGIRREAREAIDAFRAR